MEAHGQQSQAQALACLRRKMIILIVLEIFAGSAILVASGSSMDQSFNSSSFASGSVSIVPAVMTMTAGCTGIKVLRFIGNIRAVVANGFFCCIAAVSSLACMYLACKAIGNADTLVCEYDYLTNEEKCKPFDITPSVFLLVALMIAFVSCAYFMYLNIKGKRNYDSSFVPQQIQQQTGEPLLAPNSYPAPHVNADPIGGSYPMYPYPAYPTTTDPYPATAHHYPAAIHPYQTTNQPHPAANQPHPATNQPYPAANQPYQAANQTYPAATQPHPAANQPYPAAHQPHPAINQPYLAATQPHPTANRPYQPITQPYQMTTGVPNVPSHAYSAEQPSNIQQVPISYNPHPPPAYDTVAQSTIDPDGKQQLSQETVTEQDSQTIEKNDSASF